MGWLMECVVIRKQKGYWENRGFAKLPFCVIYGFGVFLALVLFAPIKDNMVAVYIAGCIGATTLEFLVAQLMLKLFGQVWWNYDHLPFNYKGILCLESTLAWGVIAVFLIGFFNTRMENFVRDLNHGLVMCCSMVLLLSYLCDFTYHFGKRLWDNKRAA
jgi:uncharacterized membrane protein